jgi:hypothetical protein
VFVPSTFDVIVGHIAGCPIHADLRQLACYRDRRAILDVLNPSRRSHPVVSLRPMFASRRARVGRAADVDDAPDFRLDLGVIAEEDLHQVAAGDQPDQGTLAIDHRQAAHPIARRDPCSFDDRRLGGDRDRRPRHQVAGSAGMPLAVRVRAV